MIDLTNGIMLYKNGIYLGIDNGTILCMMFIWVAIFVGIGCFWGWATNKIIKDKGYHQNWFWWGFFFHFWAVLVAAVKSENPDKRDYQGLNINMQYYGPQEYNPYANTQSGPAVYNMNYGNNANYGNNTDSDGSTPRFAWKCNRCGTMNESYVQTCRCGVTKLDSRIHY